MSEFNLDRDISIKNNVDAQGKKWVIHYNRGTSMCYVRPEPDRVDAIIPDELQGLWTKPSLVEPLIRKYLIESWDHADAVARKNARKAAAAKAGKEMQELQVAVEEEEDGVQEGQEKEVKKNGTKSN